MAQDLPEIQLYRSRDTRETPRVFAELRIPVSWDGIRSRSLAAASGIGPTRRARSRVRSDGRASHL